MSESIRAFLSRSRVTLRARSSAKNDSFQGKKLASNGGEFQMGFARLELQSRVEITNDSDICEQVRYDCPQFVRRIHLIDGPGERAFGKRRLLARCHGRQIRNSQRGLPQLVLIQVGDDFCCEVCVLQNNSVHRSTESRFDRRNEFTIDLKFRSECTCDGRPRCEILVVPSLQHSLRALSQPFTFLIQLPQDFETRFLFGN